LKSKILYLALFRAIEIMAEYVPNNRYTTASIVIGFKTFSNNK